MSSHFSVCWTWRVSLAHRHKSNHPPTRIQKHSWQHLSILPVWSGRVRSLPMTTLLCHLPHSNSAQSGTDHRAFPQWKWPVSEGVLTFPIRRWVVPGNTTCAAGHTAPLFWQQREGGGVAKWLSIRIWMHDERMKERKLKEGDNGEKIITRSYQAEV